MDSSRNGCSGGSPSFNTAASRMPLFVELRGSLAFNRSMLPSVSYGHAGAVLPNRGLIPEASPVLMTPSEL